jgi:hypothetical protein
MILQTPNLDEGQAAAARLFHEAVTAGAGVLAGRYVERFGNRISPDLAAELFPDYSRSPAARARLRFAVDAAARRLADEVWARVLATAADPERALVIVAGPYGCGKERVVEELSAELARHTHAVFGTSLDSPQKADQVIERALASRRQTVVAFVHCPLAQAVTEAVRLAAAAGRALPLSQIVKEHRASAPTFRWLAGRYRGERRLTFGLIDYTRDDRPELVRPAPLGLIKDFPRTTLREDEQTAHDAYAAATVLGGRRLDPEVAEAFGYRRAAGRTETTPQPDRGQRQWGRPEAPRPRQEPPDAPVADASRTHERGPYERSRDTSRSR